MSPDVLTQLIVQYKYALMAPAAFLLGPVVSLVSGVLLRLGAVMLLPTCIALAGGELTGDVIWYWLGRRWGEPFVQKFGGYVGIGEQAVSNAKRVFGRYNDQIIFFSKLTAGFGFAPAIFFTAGLSRVPFGRYMTINLAGQIIWTSGLLAIGFFLGHLLTAVRNVFEGVSSAALIVVVAIALIALGRRLRKRIDE